MVMLINLKTFLPPLTPDRSFTAAIKLFHGEAIKENTTFPAEYLHKALVSYLQMTVGSRGV